LVSGEARAIRERLLLLPRRPLRGRDLLDLELVKVRLPRAVPGIRSERLQLGAGRQPLPVELLGAASKGARRLSRPRVEQLDVVLGCEQRLMFVLTVEIDQARPDVAQHTGGAEPAIDPALRL